MISNSLRKTMNRRSGSYFLLTGATGLLGRYLLRNLLLEYVPVAVLTRGNRMASAQARMDNLVADMERMLGRRLSRPVVLAGDLGQADLGLGSSELEWANAHVGTVLHNAASLSFQTAERHEEPWLTNVSGTRTLLDLCSRIGVRQFHHVSTAYVCGQRKGRVLESERNVGQSFGNDYEKSKIEAEDMVSAHGFDSLTIYRPAIIVGDSRTGYTSTFHGVYTPLHIVHAMINKVSLEDIELTSMTDILGLEGEERKSLVPVDWVAAVITHLALDPQHHGLTYHVTPEEATPISLLSNVFAEAIITLSVDWERAVNESAAKSHQSFETFQETFREQMTTYQAYWRDDPVFDTTNTRTHAPHLPCPRLDRKTLLLLCRYAIEHNFWSAAPPVAAPEFDTFAFLKTRLLRTVGGEGNREPATVLNLCVSGPGGGDWRLQFDGQQRLCAIATGKVASGVASAITNVDCLRSIGTGKVTLESMLKGGGIILERVVADVSELRKLLQNALAGPFRT